MSENLQGQYGGFGADLKSVQFRQEREPLWQELERLMAVVERRGPDGLSFDESLAFATYIPTHAVFAFRRPRNIARQRGSELPRSPVCAGITA